MSTRFLKDNINVFRVPQFKLAYTCDKIHPSHKKLVKLCLEVHCMWWVNQDLELQQWEDFIKSNKTRILAMIMLVPNNNLYGYKQHVILFIDFASRKGVTIIYWIGKIKRYESDFEESYKVAIIGDMVNSGTTYLLLHIVQC